MANIFVINVASLEDVVKILESGVSDYLAGDLAIENAASFILYVASEDIIVGLGNLTNFTDEESNIKCEVSQWLWMESSVDKVPSLYNAFLDKKNLKSLEIENDSNQDVLNTILEEPGISLEDMKLRLSKSFEVAGSSRVTGGEMDGKELSQDNSRQLLEPILENDTNDKSELPVIAPKRKHIPFDITELSYEDYCKRHYELAIDEYRRKRTIIAGLPTQQSFLPHQQFSVQAFPQPYTQNHANKQPRM